jgi:hypothetical protein
MQDLAQDGGDVDTDPEEGEMREVEQARQAEAHVPAGRDHGIDKADDQQVAP